MSTNALMQLAAYGEQDLYLTDNPEFTFWKLVYKKHSNFSIESLPQTLVGFADFGTKISATISREGDLMWRTYVQLTVPSLTPLLGQFNTYSNRLGFCILKEVELRIGGKKIDTHYSTWMHIWTELTHDVTMKSLLDKLVGNKGVDGINGDNNNPGTLTIPLLFSYCTNPNLAIPLISLQYHEVELIITFETFNNCISDLNINNDFTAVSLSDVQLWVDYIFLDEEERDEFAKNSYDYLIEVLQHQKLSISATGKSLVDLSFNHPTKLLAFVLRDITVGEYTNITCVDPIFALGTYHTLALKSDGTLWGWGLNSATVTFGRLGLGATSVQETPIQITGFGTADDDNLYISAGSINSFVIKQDGTLWATGTNTSGSLGLGDSTARTVFTQVTSGVNNIWEKISGCEIHTLGIKTDGTLWGWGYNFYGQLGLGDNITYNTPQQVGSNTNWNKIYTSKTVTTSGIDGCSAAIKDDGTLWTTGRNTYGQLGLGNTTNRNVFTQVITAGINTWLMVSIGVGFMAGIKTDGTLWTWGVNTSGELGLGNTTQYNSPQKVGTDTDWVQVECGANFTIARKSNNNIYSTGNNTNGTLARGSFGVNRSTFAQIGSSTWIDIKGGYFYMAALSPTYYISFAGYNQYANFGQNYTPVTGNYRAPTIAPGISNNNWISTGFFPHTSTNVLFIKVDGTLWASGLNQNGQLGLGDTTTRTIITQVGTDTWNKVDNGGTSGSSRSFSAGIKSNGTLWTWGNNTYGQLGLGNTTQYTSPQQVGVDNTWIFIACGKETEFMIGIKSNGTMWGWGRNTSGQLGLGNNTSPILNPTQIGTDTNWLSAQLSGAVGNGTTIAMKTNGTIWSTGAGGQGVLGLGINFNINTFAQIGTSTWSIIQSSGFSAWGIKTDGTMWSWGSNGQGQLGLGNTTSYNSPQQIGVDNNWSKISSLGYYFPKAIKTNGTLWTWGWNIGYALGTNNSNTLATQLSPLQIGTDTDWVDVYGGSAGMAIKSNGYKYIWGTNAQTYLTYTDNRYISLLELPDVMIDNCVEEIIGLTNINYFTNFGSISNNSTLSTAKLTINGTDRFKERDNNFFNYIQPYQHFNIKPDIGINIYSFALKPANHQPSGTFNLSMVDKLILEITPTSNASNTNNTPLELLIYALSYNVLKISNGMGGLAFSS
jgi:alpha-tubulin suppressor-like RCC1 family protein